MNFLFLFLIIFLSTELIIKFNYILLIKSLIYLSKKASKVILNKKISDHWKEKIIQEYSFKMMKLSFLMIFIFTLIIVLFLLPTLFINDFLNFISSVRGIISSILFAFGYIYLKNLIKK
tara:strand:+ start:199 stop:555 length:357 start_codon:yes stop_codon:yes gene_type:complete